MNNRVAVTVRFNQDEQRAMRDLIAFWSDKGLRTPKDIIKFAFEQLVISQSKMEKMIKEQAAKEAEEEKATAEQATQPVAEAPATQEQVNA